MTSNADMIKKEINEFKEFVIEQIKEREKKWKLIITGTITAYTGIIEKLQKENDTLLVKGQQLTKENIELREKYDELNNKINW
jgi:predicted nuclease with TOPRIM domain